MDGTKPVSVRSFRNVNTFRRGALWLPFSFLGLVASICPVFISNQKVNCPSSRFDCWSECRRSEISCSPCGILRLCLNLALLVLVAILVSGGSSSAIAQERGNNEEVSVSRGEARLQSLQTIVETIRVIEGDIAERQRELGSPQGRGRQEEIEQDIAGLVRRKDQLSNSFLEFVTEVDLDALTTSPQIEEFDWHQELGLLLTPLIRELRALTNRPREMERLRAERFDLEQKLKLYSTGLVNVEKVLQEARNSTLDPRLKSIAREWKERQSELQTQYQIVTQKLENRENKRSSIAETVTRFTRVFFRSKGRNIVFAILITLLFAFVMRKLYVWLHRFPAFHDGRRRFHIRLFEITYVASSFAGSVGVFIVILYFLGDWVLLTIFLVLLLALLWTSKQAVSRFSAQTMLLLNLGPVREGERILFNGLPWRVRLLHVYSILENPLLTGGVVRVPLTELLNARSREFDPKEPWFPTREGDWILLGSQEFGKVVLQTSEVVRIVLPGGSFISYPTQTYLTLNPQVLSTGFRISVVFGIDYHHQSIFTTEARVALQEFINKGLAEEGYDEMLCNITVDVKQAGASSLDFEILADFDGKAAQDYPVLRRHIQRLCIDACNAFDWSIPFTQVTLHVPEQVHFSAVA
jgi:small-conductance mechanosensitive channel